MKEPESQANNCCRFNPMFVPDNGKSLPLFFCETIWPDPVVSDASQLNQLPKVFIFNALCGFSCKI
jgi:hypothetical protein